MYTALGITAVVGADRHAVPAKEEVLLVAQEGVAVEEGAPVVEEVAVGEDAVEEGVPAVVEAAVEADAPAVVEVAVVEAAVEEGAPVVVEAVVVEDAVEEGVNHKNKISQILKSK